MTPHHKPTTADRGDTDTKAPSQTLSRRRSLQALASAGATLAGLGSVFSASARGADCIVYDEPGEYTLSSDVDCVEITAPKVNLDGQGHVADRVAVQADKARVQNISDANEIRLQSAANCEIVGNTFRSGYDHSASFGGLRLIDSQNNLIENNTKPGFGVGLWLAGSSKNSITDNQFDGELALTVDGSNKNTLIGNTAGSEDTNARFINSHDNRIAENVFRYGFYYTVTMNQCHGNSFQGNDIQTSGFGIRLLGDESNRVEDNRINGSPSTLGISLQGTAQNSVLNNVLRGPSLGVDLADADRNRIIGNQLVEVPCESAEPVRSDSESTDNIVRKNTTDC